MKKLAIAVILCMVFSIIVGGVALAGNPATGAGAQKADLWDTLIEANWTLTGGATITLPPTYGFVIFNTNASGDLIVQIAVKGAAGPDEFYVYINQVTSGPSITNYQVKSIGVGGTLANFNTNAKGNGNVHYKIPRDATADKFWVTVTNSPDVFDDPEDQWLRNEAVTVD